MRAQWVRTYSQRGNEKQQLYRIIPHLYQYCEKACLSCPGGKGDFSFQMEQKKQIGVERPGIGLI